MAAPWSLTTVNNINTIRILQNKCIRIINHTPFNSNTNNLFEDNKLLKLDDIIKLEQLKLVFLFKNVDFPNELNALFKLNVYSYNTRNELNALFKLNVYSYNTRNASKGGSAFLRYIRLLLAVGLLSIPHLLLGMNVSNQLKTLWISRILSQKFYEKILYQ